MVVLPNCDTVFNHLVKIDFKYPVSIDFSYIVKIVFNYTATIIDQINICCPVEFSTSLSTFKKHLHFEIGCCQVLQSQNSF